MNYESCETTNKQMYILFCEFVFSLANDLLLLLTILCSFESLFLWSGNPENCFGVERSESIHESITFRTMNNELDGAPPFQQYDLSYFWFLFGFVFVVVVAAFYSLSFYWVVGQFVHCSLTRRTSQRRRRRL